MQARNSELSSGPYSRLLAAGGFEAFLWTQFLGAFNDNVYKMMVSMLAVEIASNAQLGARYLAIAGAVFVLPYLLFAGHAGQLADRFSKTRVLQITKALEVVTMSLGLFALVMNRIELLLGVLFLLAMQANFFSPAKYGILPELMSEAELTPANGLVEFSTLAAIVLGTSFGSFLIHAWKHNPWRLGATLLAIAAAGTVCSWKIPKVPPSGFAGRFHWNPFHEVWIGFRTVARNRALSLTVAGLSYFWFVGALFQMTILLAGKEVLHASEFEVGLLATALAAGIGIGSIVAGWLSRDHIKLVLVPVGGLLLGIFSISLAASHSYAAILAWLVAVGFSGGLFFVPLNAFLQERAGRQEKGRLIATNSFFNMLGILLASAALWLLHDKLHWSAASIIAALGCLTVVATIYIVSVLPREILRLVLCSVSRFIFSVRVVGADRVPSSGGALLVANHVSYADAVLLGGCTHRFIRFLIWKPYFERKFAKPFFTMLQAIPIHPGSPKDALKSLRKAGDELKRGELVCIFPEGALTRTGHVQPFHRGVERLHEYSPAAPIIPIYLDGLWRHPLAATGSRSLRDWIRAWRREIRIVIGTPITGPISAPELRLRILELGTEAVNLRKKADSTLVHALVRSARSNWSRPALADSTKKQLSYGETLTAAVLIRQWLRSARANEPHIATLLPTSVVGALVNFGVTLAGKSVVNLNFTAGEASCRSAIEQCAIRTVITSKIFLAKAGLPAWPEMIYIEDLLSGFKRTAKLRASLFARFAPVNRIAGHITPDSIATILFSSGSTGTPKGIELTHWNILSNIEAAATVFRMHSDDCTLGVLPLFHSFGYTFALWFPMVQQFRAVFHPNPTDAKAIGDLARAHRATFLLSTPTFCGHYIRKCARDQFSSLRFVLVGAEKLHDSVAEAFRNKFGMSLLAGYGATELGPCAAANTPDIANGDGAQSGTRPGSVGRTLPGASVRIIHPETREAVAPGTTGLLLVNSPSRMARYHRAPGKTQEVLHDGFYETGDLAYLDEDGFLFITDRLSRFSKIAGEMVPHLKIEEAAGEILAYSSCFVTGVPDERRGERLVMLFADPRVTPAQIAAHLSAALPPLWIPKRENIFLMDAIPVLGTGKTDLAKARAMALQKMQTQPENAVEADLVR